MNRTFGILSMCLVLCVVDGPVALAQPSMHIERTAHDFGPVFDVDHVAYTFTVFNRGSSDLIIDDVTTR